MASVPVNEETISKYVFEHLDEAIRLLEMVKDQNQPSREFLIGDYFVQMAHEHFCQKLCQAET